jgi:hypothetical protein
LLPLLAVLTASAQVAAQDSPAPEAEPDTAASESEVAPDAVEAPMEETPVAESTTASDDSGYSDSGYRDSGYSDAAPEADMPTEVEVDAADIAPMLRVRAELGFFAASGDAGHRVTLSPIFGVGLGLSDAILVGATWGLNYQNDSAPDASMLSGSLSTAVVGNPLLWVARRSRSKDTHMNIGGGVALPLASLPDDVADQAIAASAYAHASAIRGDWNAWLWATDKLSGVVNYDAHAVMDEVLVGGETAVALLIPTAGEDDAAFIGQVAAELGYAVESVRVVMRAQLVATVTPAVDDALQFSIDPYVAWDISDSVTLNGRTTVNIDNPTGFEGSRVWGLRLGADIKL